MEPSADGRGRTLFEILSGRNKKDQRPMELRYPNPLGAKIGCTVSFKHDTEISGISFVIEKIAICTTIIRSKSFVCTDYYIKGVTLERDKPYRYRLRLTPDADESNELRCKVQLFKLYDEMEWDEAFYKDVLGHTGGEIDVNYDDNGAELPEPNRYWRIEDVLTPYKAKITLLSDKDGDGEVEESELEKYDIEYWDYHREYDDATTGVATKEYLLVEMNSKSHYFSFLRGKDLDAFQIVVI